MNLHSLFLSVILFSLLFASTFSNNELWKDCWGTDLIYYDQQCCNESSKLKDSNFHCLEKVPQIDGYEKLNEKLHTNFEELESCAQQKDCSSNMTFLQLREITGNIEQQTEELAQQGVETLQPKSPALTDISNGLLGNLTMTNGSMSFLGNSTIKLKTLDIKRIAVPSTEQKPAEIGFLSSQSGTLNIMTDLQLDPNQDDVKNRHLNVNLKSNFTKFNGSKIHVKGSELAVLRGLVANVSFQGTNTSVYKGTSCLGNNDCKSECMLDSNCKGYSRIENTRPVLDTTRHEYDVITEITYGAKTCTDDQDCALKCTNDTTCQGFSILDLFNTSFQSMKRYQYGAPYTTGCSVGNSTSKSDCIYTFSNVSIDATITEYDCRNYVDDNTDFTFSGDLNSMVSPSTCIIDVDGKRAFFNSASNNVACGAVVQVSSGDFFTSSCLIKTGLSWLQPATTSKEKKDAFNPTLFVTFEYGLEGNTSIDDAFSSYKKIVDKSPALNATYLNMLKGLNATAAQINKLADMNVDFGSFAALDSLDINPGDLNVMNGVSASLSKTELDKLVGLTANSSHLNVLRGVKSSIRRAFYHGGDLSMTEQECRDYASSRGVGFLPASSYTHGYAKPRGCVWIWQWHFFYFTEEESSGYNCPMFQDRVQCFVKVTGDTSGVTTALNNTVGLESSASELNVLKDASTDLGKAELDLLVGLDVSSKVCSDPSKTTEAKCLYDLVTSGQPDDSKGLNETECEAFANKYELAYPEIGTLRYLGTDHLGGLKGCFIDNHVYVKYSNAGTHDCGLKPINNGETRPCIQKTTNTFTFQQSLNVMKGVTSSFNASELSRLVGLTAEASELNVLLGVNSALNSTHLNHLIGLQSNASHLNVLKDANTALGKAELDLLVGLDVNAGDLNVMKGVSSSLNASELSRLVGLTAEASELNVFNVIITVQKLSLGQQHSCSLLSDGLLKCWGSNSYGQLG